MRKPLDPYTLRALATRLSRERKYWLQNVPDETYGSGFRDGMAEMARRIIADCRAHALGLEKETRSLTKTRKKAKAK